MQTCHPVSICPDGEKSGIGSENLPLEAGAIRQDSNGRTIEQDGSRGGVYKVEDGIGMERSEMVDGAV